MKPKADDQECSDGNQRRSDACTTQSAAGRYGRWGALLLGRKGVFGYWFPAWLGLLAMLLLAIGVAGCGGGEPVGPTPTDTATTTKDVTATSIAGVPTPTTPPQPADDAAKTPDVTAPTDMPTASATATVTSTPAGTPPTTLTPTPPTEHSTLVSTETPTKEGNGGQLVEIPPAGSDPVEYRKAIEELDRVIVLDPDNALAYRRRGLAHFLLGDHGSALDDFLRAVELDPSDAIAYYHRGVSLASLWVYDLAIEDFDMAFELDPGLEETMAPNTHVGRAYALRASDNLSEREFGLAIEDYEIAIAFDPDNTEALNNLCWSLSLTGRPAEALPHCNRALHIDPNAFETRDSRGLAHALLGDYEQAVEDFTRFLEWLATQPSHVYDIYASARERWIASLRNGENPFDETELEALRNE